jgi:2-oxoglutarate dehydrogenase E1 component
MSSTWLTQRRSPTNGGPISMHCAKLLPPTGAAAMTNEPHAPVVSSFVALARRPRTTGVTLDDGLAVARKQVAVQSLIASVSHGWHAQGKFGPLMRTAPQALVELTPTFYGLTATDMSTRFSTADRTRVRHSSCIWGFSAA